MKNDKNKQVTFADYVDTYQKEIQSSINFIGKDVDFFIELKASLIKKGASDYFGKTKGLKVLDVGCGIGLVDNHLINDFDNLYGVDIEDDVIQRAKEHNPSVKYEMYDAKALPFKDNSFNIAFAINVMHHVPHGSWQGFTNEMYRVLKPGGLAMIFEHNPYNPLTRRVVNRCEFDKDAVLLKQNKTISLLTNSGFDIHSNSYIIFFPFKNNIFRKLERTITWLPLGAQYYVCGVKK